MPKKSALTQIGLCPSLNTPDSLSSSPREFFHFLAPLLVGFPRRQTPRWKSAWNGREGSRAGWREGSSCDVVWQAAPTRRVRKWEEAALQRSRFRRAGQAFIPTSPVCVPLPSPVSACRDKAESHCLSRWYWAACHSIHHHPSLVSSCNCFLFKILHWLPINFSRKFSPRPSYYPRP